MGRQLFSITKNNVKNFVVSFFLLIIFLIFIFQIGLTDHFYFKHSNASITLVFYGFNNQYMEQPALDQIWIGFQFFEHQTTTSHIYSAFIMILTLLSVNFIATFSVLFAPTNYGVISFIVDFFSKIALVLVIVLTIVILVQFHNFTGVSARKVKDVSNASISATTLGVLITFGIVMPVIDIVISLSKRIIW